MTTPVLRKIAAFAAALATTTTLAVAAGPADAARYIGPTDEDTTFSYEPTGTRTMANEKPHGGFQTGDTGTDCTNATKNANSWQADARIKYDMGDDTWEQSQANADAIAGQANADYGCTITYQE